MAKNKNKTKVEYYTQEDIDREFPSEISVEPMDEVTAESKSYFDVFRVSLDEFLDGDDVSVIEEAIEKYEKENKK